MKTFYPEPPIFVSIRVFLHRHWWLTALQGKGGDYLLFHSSASIHSRTFRHLFPTLHVRWLSHIFNRTPCIYQTATWWDLPPYRTMIWLIDDVTLVFFGYLHDDLILAFLLQQFETGNWWIRTSIDYHLCITSEPTNQHIFRSNRSQMFFKTAVLKDFAIFWIKKGLQQRCFFCEYC